MATSSILGTEQAPTRAPGRDADALGPSDSSDSGSDTLGERSKSTTTEEGLPVGATPTDRDAGTDAEGTGERGSAIPENVEDGADIGPDRIETIGTPDDDTTTARERRADSEETPKMQNGRR